MFTILADILANHSLVHTAKNLLQLKFENCLKVLYLKYFSRHRPVPEVSYEKSVSQTYNKMGAEKCREMNMQNGVKISLLHANAKPHTQSLYIEIGCSFSDSQPPISLIWYTLKLRTGVRMCCIPEWDQEKRLLSFQMIRILH